MLIALRSALMNGDPRRVFTWEIRSKDGVCQCCLKKGAILLRVQGMKVEKRGREDPRCQPWQGQQVADSKFPA